MGLKQTEQPPKSKLIANGKKLQVSCFLKKVQPVNPLN